MAYNIFWKIPFMSLRSGVVYTINIYKDGTLPSGYPLTLKGGAEPFTTDEDASEMSLHPSELRAAIFVLWMMAMP